MRTKAQKANYDKVVKRIRRFAFGNVDYTEFRQWYRYATALVWDITPEDYRILSAREELAFRYFRRNGGEVSLQYCLSTATQSVLKGF